jgi:replicative DNA helicase
LFLDFDLLQVLRNREQFNRFKPYIKEHAVGKETVKLINGMEEYFKSFPSAKEIDWDAFGTWFLVIKQAQLSKDSIPTYRTILDNLKSKAASPVADELLRHYITCDYATRIANEAVAVAGGKPGSDIDEIGKLLQGYDREVGRALKMSDLFVTDDTEVAVPSDPGLEWRLEELNISCGPLRQGDFIIIGARPETGKTTFITDQVSYMGEQMAGKHERPIIHVNNEERSSKVKRRYIQSALGITLRDFMADQPKAIAEYQRKMGMKDRVLITGSGAGLNSVKHLVPLFRDLNPALIVFDQLDKVAGFGDSDREDLRLGSLYQWARDLSHEYGPVLSASQASESAEGQQWIFQHQLRGSKTDKAGEADAIITIGKVHDPLKEHTRFIHIPKNKLDGGPRSVEKDRHGYWEVEIKPEIARYVGTK